MSDSKLLTTELMLKDLIRDTDKAVAKAQAAMAKIVGKAEETTATPQTTALPEPVSPNRGA